MEAKYYSVWCGEFLVSNRHIYNFKVARYGLDLQNCRGQGCDNSHICC